MEERKTHISSKKQQLVKNLADKMKKNTVMVVSIKGLPSAQFQDIKKKIRKIASIQVAKKSLVDFALDHCGIKELHSLVPYVDESTALLFADMDAFEVSKILSENKSPSKAKAGDVAIFDIEVKAGPTDLVPGPDISALSSVGLIPKVEAGKISVMQNKIIVKQGDKITDKVASIMAKLNIIPFEVGIEPVAAYMDKIVYANIKIDTKSMIEELEYCYSRALPFAVEINYANNLTIDFIIAKAALHEKALSNILQNSSVESSEIKNEESDARVEVEPSEGATS